MEAINKESAREKSIRHGHPSTLHLWWARRPLAACRAVLFAQLVDDPDSDPAYRNADGSVDEDRAGLKRAQLFNLIEELVKWENSNCDRVINAARAEIARCVASRLIEEGKLQKETIIHGKDEGKAHPKGPISGEFRTAWEVIVYGNGDLEALERRTTRLCPPDVVNHFLATYAPPVLDPFAGGGSIPLEAQRLGLRAYASDLNPVPVLINKALIEIPPKFANQPPVNPEAQKKLKTARYHGAEGLAEDVRYYGKWMRDEAEKRIGHLYPKVKITKEMAKDRPDLREYVGQELTVIAWLWARTVKSSNPAFADVDVPLASSFWLSKKEGKEAWVEPVLTNGGGHYVFRVRRGMPPESKRELADRGTKLGRGCKFKCLLSGQPIPEEHIKSESLDGRMGARLMAVAIEGQRERLYLCPTAEEEQRWLEVSRPSGLDAVESPIGNDKRALWCLIYGLTTFDRLFTNRQLQAMTVFAELATEVREEVLRSSSRNERETIAINDYAAAVCIYCALVVSRLANYCSSLCGWSSHAKDQMAKQVFGRQGLPMVWDYAENNPFSESGGSFFSHLSFTASAIERLPASGTGTVRQADAARLADISISPVVSTDPPYYDNIGYSDLADYFYVWLRKALVKLDPELFATRVTPKSQELIASPYRHNGESNAAREFFENGLDEVLRHLRGKASLAAPLTIFYAFKQAETSDDLGSASTGWETFLTGIIKNGFAVSGTWPVRTELTTNLKKSVAALASSVVLSCIPRQPDAPMATRREFLNMLKRELPDAMRKLQSGNIAPVDLAQAAIGPGMAVFSRYSKVVESDGDAMTVRAALTLINQVLDEVLAEQEGEFDGDTRWAVAWFETHGMQEGPYGVAETLSKAKNTSVHGLVEAGVINARGGKVRLIAREDMPEDWDPTTDNRATCWEATQHMIRRLQNEGEQSAAKLLARLGGDYGEMARDLAYRLYSICERKGWAQEALAYNSLVIAWSEISKLSRTVSESKPAKPAGLFE